MLKFIKQGGRWVGYVALIILLCTAVTGCHSADDTPVLGGHYHLRKTTETTGLGTPFDITDSVGFLQYRNEALPIPIAWNRKTGKLTFTAEDFTLDLIFERTTESGDLLLSTPDKQAEYIVKKYERTAGHQLQDFFDDRIRVDTNIVAPVPAACDISLPPGTREISYQIGPSTVAAYPDGIILLGDVAVSPSDYASLVLHDKRNTTPPLLGTAPLSVPVVYPSHAKMAILDTLYMQLAKLGYETIYEMSYRQDGSGGLLMCPVPRRIGGRNPRD